MKTVNLVSFIVLLAGGINWLSIGLFQYDIIAGVFGSQAAIGSRIVYIIVGVAALYLIYSAFVERGKLSLMECENNKSM